MKKKRAGAFKILYLIFGLYFLNFKIKYIKLPDMVIPLNNWIIFTGGILFLIAFFRSIIYSKKRIIRHAMKQ